MRRTMAGAAASILLALSVCLPPALAEEEAPIQLDLRWLFEDAYWTDSARVVVTNRLGETKEAVLEAPESSWRQGHERLLWSLPLTLPPVRSEVVLYHYRVHKTGLLRLREPGGRIFAEDRLYFQPQQGIFRLVVVGSRLPKEHQPALSFLNWCPPEWMPTHAADYRLCHAVMLLDLDPKYLTPPRLEALRSFVQQGGALIITGSASKQARQRLAQAGLLPEGKEKQLGLGKLVFSPLTLNSQALNSQLGKQLLLKLTNRYASKSRQIGVVPVFNYVRLRDDFTKLLGSLHALPPGRWTVVGIWVGYLLLLLALCLWLWRKVKWRPKVWLILAAAPVLTAAFLSFLGFTIKGHQPVFAAMCFFRTQAGQRLGRLDAVGYLATPTSGWHEAVAAPQVAVTDHGKRYFSSEPLPAMPIAYREIQSENVRLRFWRALWHPFRVGLSTAADLKGMIDGKVRLNGRNVEIVVRNRTPHPLQDVRLIWSHMWTQTPGSTLGAPPGRSLVHKQFSLWQTLLPAGAASPHARKVFARLDAKGNLVGEDSPYKQDDVYSMLNDFLSSTSVQSERPSLTLVGWVDFPLPPLLKVDGQTPKTAHKTLLVLTLPVPAALEVIGAEQGSQ